MCADDDDGDDEEDEEGPANAVELAVASFDDKLELASFGAERRRGDEVNKQTNMQLATDKQGEGGREAA